MNELSPEEIEAEARALVQRARPAPSTERRLATPLRGVPFRFCNGPLGVNPC